VPRKTTCNADRRIADELQSTNIRQLEELDARDSLMNTIKKYLSGCPEAFGSAESFTAHNITCYGDLLKAHDEVLQDIVDSLQEENSLAEYAVAS
jgi:hypothetical protein